MTSIDQENLRRAQAERRIAMQNESGGAGWVIGIIVVVAIIAGIFLLGSGGGDGTAATTGAPALEEAAPATADQTAPATTVTE